MKSRPAGYERYILLILALATCLAYLPALQAGFTSFDDGQYVTENPNVLSGLTMQGIRWAFNIGYAGNWHPMTWISHMTDSSLFGTSPVGPHAVNLLLHIANTLLLFIVLKKMTGASWKSALVAALFALHPLHVESVAWVAERKDVLSTLFLLLTVLAYTRYAEHPGLKRYVPVMMLFALGLMSKPSLVTLPIVLMLLDIWPLRRTGSGVVTEKIPLLILSAGSCILTYLAQQKAGAVSTLGQVPAALRIENAVCSYVSYIAKMLWPAKLAVFYPYPESIPVWQVVGSALLLVCVTILAIRGMKRRPYLLAGWLWYVVTLLPMIGVVQVGSQSMADRYTYVSLIGIFIIIAWGVPDLLRGMGKGTERIASPMAIVSLAILVSLSAVTWRQAGYWHDNVILFSHALDVTNRNAMAHDSLGIALAKLGKPDEAKAEFRKALEIAPNDHLAHGNLGFALAQEGSFDEAAKELSEAVRIDPQLGQAHLNLARVLVAQGKPNEAEGHYRQSLQLDPGDPDARYELAVLLAKRGDINQAVGEFSLLVSQTKDSAKAHYGLGIALCRQGKIREAMVHFNEVLRLDPGFTRVHVQMAEALYNQGDYLQSWQEVAACREYGHALHPDFLKALSAKMPEPSEADKR